MEHWTKASKCAIINEKDDYASANGWYGFNFIDAAYSQQ
jgi:hypothetical protein